MRISNMPSFFRYGFLLRQLVGRDFKAKYKRSVLGVLWSFLNPLITMTVQYIVFSTVFKAEVHNFPVYLLIGIVCFNYFNESTSMSLMSIISNASLITKVYVPKYIFPVSRVLSSTVNLVLSIIPLIIALVITRTPISFSWLLLPFGIACLLLLCLGIGFTLSSLMVFFRDTQFLWNVICMLWMYATPIFYPESIIPDKFIIFIKINPLYHIIKLLRISLMEGVFPGLNAFLLCILVSVIPLLFGIFIFRKTQDKFVLYI